MEEFKVRAAELVKTAEEKGETPLVWVMEAGRLVQDCGMSIPSLELAEFLVANICFDNNRPVLWKFLDQAMASRLVFPIHSLALLTNRIIPHHKRQPEAFRLYLELLGLYILSYSSTHSLICQQKMTKSIDDAMHISTTFGINIRDIGQTAMWFLFSVIIIIIDSLLEDSGLHLESAEKKCISHIDAATDMIFDTQGIPNNKRIEHSEVLHTVNVLVAGRILEKITATKTAKILLRLIHLNLPQKFNCLLQRLQFIQNQKPTSQILKPISHELEKLFGNVQDAMHGFPSNRNQLIGSLIDASPYALSNYYSPGAGQSACWISFDIFLEKAMDGRQLYVVSAADILAGVIISLQVVNQATWQETFKELWLSALRLVQRVERISLEGPIPHIDARLCLLLSITPLAIASILNQEDEIFSTLGDNCHHTQIYNIKYLEGKSCSSRRRGLVSSLQLLGQFTGLLSPPPSLVDAANYAASKAATFISNFKKGNESLNDICRNSTSIKAIGNMLHLIVEACIARKLIDTSVYFWSGYVVTSSTLSTDSMSAQEAYWSAFMNGAKLTVSLTNSLMTIPALSIVQVEKLYQIALNGPEEERSAAAKILCGASLFRGWNIQEHVVCCVVKLLSPPVLCEFSEPVSHLFGYMSMLNSVLFGASTIDVVHIMSLHGMVPEVAAALIPLCEAFGSLLPKSNAESSSVEPSVYSVFSCAFLFLLRLWKFYSHPQEHSIAERWAHTEMTLDYLLLIHNSRVSSSTQNSVDAAIIDALAFSSDKIISQPLSIDAFPKLQAWYLQNQACAASTLSGVCRENPIHQVANQILNIICQKMTKTGSSVQQSSASTSSISGSSAIMEENTQPILCLPAWEILRACPFVLESLLSACASGNLSSRELTTGLRDLVDLLPASLGTILTYFSAEVTRGVWKQVEMNGTDWPSPASDLLLVESQVRELLASVGVDIPKFFAGRTLPAMLPLPMAALVGLTITFKLDKSLEYIHGVVGPALENCAASCPWPTMPIIGALWEQKVRRWHDFIILSCVRSPFRQDRDAICQLIRRCFESFLGQPFSSGSHISSYGVKGLLGSAFKENGAALPVAPGFLYIRSCRSFIDTRLVSHEILKLVATSARNSASGRVSCGLTRLKSEQVSTASASVRAKQISTLGASLLCAAGGLRLVQVLYMETMPTWLIARSETDTEKVPPSACMLEGYALAHLMILCGTFVWGVGDTVRPNLEVSLASRSRRSLSISYQMDFIARAFQGDVYLGCHPVTWKSYVSCFLTLMVRFVPAWVQIVSQETLKKLADGLRGWHENELAISLLERGGPDAIGSVVDLIM